ncbi:unnamed protein product [Penicillium bialowiezense]
MPDAFLTEAASLVPLSSSTSSHLLSTHSRLLPTSASKGATVYKCLRCHRRTVLPPKQNPHFQVPAQAVGIAASSAQDSTGAAPGSAQAATESKSGENQNSKKRAKARKQGGLQALLASKQQAQPSLDLLDFLQ